MKSVTSHTYVSGITYDYMKKCINKTSAKFLNLNQFVIIVQLSIAFENCRIEHISLENDEIMHKLSTTENENKHLKQRIEDQRREVLEISKAKDDALTRYAVRMLVSIIFAL